MKMNEPEKYDGLDLYFDDFLFTYPDPCCDIDEAFHQMEALLEEERLILEGHYNYYDEEPQENEEDYLWEMYLKNRIDPLAVDDQMPSSNDDRSLRAQRRRDNMKWLRRRMKYAQIYKFDDARTLAQQWVKIAKSINEFYNSERPRISRQEKIIRAREAEQMKEIDTIFNENDDEPLGDSNSYFEFDSDYFDYWEDDFPEYTLEDNDDWPIDDGFDDSYYYDDFYPEEFLS